MKFPTISMIAFVCMLLLLPPSLIMASSEHDHGANETHDHHDHDEQEHGESQVTIPSALAKQSGIQTQTVGGGVLQQRVLLFGRLKPDPQHISHIRARFPGLIRQVNVQIGESIKAETVIARIEANDSLRVYDITSPIDGVVIDRHANAGEFTGEEILFTLANYSQLELDLSVFARDTQNVRVGQRVDIYQMDARSSQAIAHGTITYLTAGSGDTPTVTAHVPIDNKGQQLMAGALVEALVTVAEDKVALLIEKRAVQQHDGQSVVFVRHGDHYTASPIIVGRGNAQFVEVLSGLQAGEDYVVDNSFLLKADLEKSGAAHVH
jgi:membrane fusion protein, heavy metal efflux system